MLFTADAHAGLADGSITVTFRRWKRPQAKVGGRYRAGSVVLAVDEVSQVRVGTITADEVRRTGAADRDALLRRLGVVDDGVVVWRVAFRRVREDPPVRKTPEMTEVVGRLERLDRASAHGPWTRAVLELIAARPGVVSTELARDLGRERAAFKADVRKLKRLGLTESLEVGYRLSSLGESLVAARVGDDR